jgi:hypothetical protein
VRRREKEERGEERRGEERGVTIAPRLHSSLGIVVIVSGLCLELQEPQSHEERRHRERREERGERKERKEGRRTS